jgi:hypothetical protein
MAEGEASDEDSDSSQNAVEQIEGSDCADTDEIEECAFDTQVSEGLMQALEDAIFAVPRWC